MKKAGWYDVRLLGLTDVIGDQDDVPRGAFEQTAAKKLVAGETWYEEVSEKDGKRYMRVVTGIPVVSENCVMCQPAIRSFAHRVGDQKLHFLHISLAFPRGAFFLIYAPKLSP